MLYCKQGAEVSPIEPKSKKQESACQAQIVEVIN